MATIKEKPRKKQKYIELWARCTDIRIGCWGWTLYIAYPDGKLEGYYDQTFLGELTKGSWERTLFKRDSVVELDNSKWQFLGELK